jgi:hypothetical protein
MLFHPYDSVDLKAAPAYQKAALQRGNVPAATNSEPMRPGA